MPSHPQRVDVSQNSSLKVPPQDTEAELAVLAGILINNEAMNQVLEIITPDDFYREAHGHIFGAMIDLYNNNEPIDLITLSHSLKQKGRLESVGGSGYLTSLTDAVSTSAGILYHSEIIRDSSVRRRLIIQCSAISESCFQNWRDTDEILDLAEQSIFEIAESKVKEEFVRLDSIVKDTFKKVESLAEHEGFITGVPSGFVDLDRYTAGLQPSDLIIIAGRPGTGKTALALNMAYNAASSNQTPVAIFSLEMAKIQLGMRLLGFASNVDIKQLRTGYFSDGREMERIVDAASRLSELPIFVEDSSALSVLEMKAKCRRLMKKSGLGLVIVDYLQLIQGRRSAESRQMEISEISRSLKGLAKDLNVPIIALSQLNRKVEDRTVKRPQLADLRESGAIEQDADVIIFLYKDESQPPASPDVDILNADIAKQRNGPIGIVKLAFQRRYTRFRDFTNEDQPS
ncbi:MAG: replicative DNA helicase [Desulfobacteraceae bacterium]|nr:MAG: replicative DNA helicase [Desulfobacteraceae bacterium]